MAKKLHTILLDTETIGLHGLPVLLQYSVDDGDVKIVHLWTTPVDEIMSLIEFFVDNRVVAHNLRFDWFHLSKLYNICRLLDPKKTLKDYPVGVIADKELEAQHGPCLKPKAAVDTLILAQRGEAQAAVMESKPVWVRQIYKGMAESVRYELESKTGLPWILFAGRADKEAPLWSIVDRKHEMTGEIEADWVDLKLSFKPSNGLKDLCKFLFDYDPIRYDEIALPSDLMPAEEGYAPYVRLLTSEEKQWFHPVKKGDKYVDCPTWPALIDDHIEHWANDEDAMVYAIEDIHMLRMLYEFFKSPEKDQDSMLACQVASVRIRGFAADLDEMRRQRAISQAIVDAAPVNVNSPTQVKGYIAEAMDEAEQIVIAKSCSKETFKKIRKTYTLDEEEECLCENQALCARCEGKGTVGPGPMPFLKRVDEVENVRKHRKRIELFDKILLAGRCYPDFNVIGAKSGRMSGASGLNFQGIAKKEDVRACFNLADEGWILCGGDYDSQELAILATTAADDDLLEDIKGGKSLHGLMAAELFDTTYEEIMKNKDERYDKAKSCVYLMVYGGSAPKMAETTGLSVEVCQNAINNFLAKYAKMGVERQVVEDRFKSLTQGEDRRFEYNPPEDPYVESIFGFRRYFTNEYAIQKTILDVMENMPQSWQDLQMNVMRKEGRVQSLSGAICSALIGSAFSIQNRIIRAAMNHLIQSVGRSLTLGLQYNIWENQPQGIHDYKLCVMGIHDESAVACLPEMVEPVKQTVVDTIAEQSERITLIAMTWASGLPNWYGLKAANDDPESKYYCEDMVPCGWAAK